MPLVPAVHEERGEGRREEEEWGHERERMREEIETLRAELAALRRGGGEQRGDAPLRLELQRVQAENAALKQQLLRMQSFVQRKQ